MRGACGPWRACAVRSVCARVRRVIACVFVVRRVLACVLLCVACSRVCLCACCVCVPPRAVCVCPRMCLRRAASPSPAPGIPALFRSLRVL